MEHIQSKNSPLEWLDLVVIPIVVNAKNISKQSTLWAFLDSQRGEIMKWGEKKKIKTILLWSRIIIKLNCLHIEYNVASFNPVHDKMWKYKFDKW